MLLKTKFSIKDSLLEEAKKSIPLIDFRLPLNQPTGDFFYDPWEIKSEFKNTCWEELLNSIPHPIGESRLISLSTNYCYSGHADIDDRYHLNITGDNSYLVDITNEKLFKIFNDCNWYTINAGVLHSAVNFGNVSRIQLVVRILLNRNTLNDPIHVSIKPKNKLIPYRYIFDQSVSGWLNEMNKTKVITEFKHVDDTVTFYVENNCLSSLVPIIPPEFDLIVNAI